MNWTYLRACKSSLPAIKARWEDFLDKEPAWGRLESRERLSAAMDVVLEGLWTVLQSSDVPDRVRKTPPVNLPAWSVGACRLDSTLAFLAAGKRSLQVAVHKAQVTQSDLPREERSEQWAELMLAFDIVSQREIDRICGVCYKKKNCAFGETVSGADLHEDSAVPQVPKAHQSLR